MAGPCPPLVLLLAAPLNSVNSVAGLCGWTLSSSCPPLGRAPELCQLCGSSCELCQLLAGPCPPLVLLLAAPLNSVNSVAGLCGWALSSSCPPFVRAPELCQLWLGPVAGPCPPLVLLSAAPLNSVNSVAGLCVQALSSSCPPLGRALLLSFSWLRP